MDQAVEQLQDEKNISYYVRSLPFQLLWRVFFVFLLLNSVTRLGLMIFNQETTAFLPQYALAIFGFGFLYDVSVGLWSCLPIVLCLLCISWSSWFKRYSWIIFSVIVTLSIFSWCFVSVSEFVFWNEFASRFNFIAVDYLIYTREVIGNINESYAMTPILAGLAGFAGLVSWALIARLRAIKEQFLPLSISKLFRVGVLASYIGLASLLTWTVKTDWKDVLTRFQHAQLAGNGVWEFFYAFRFNQIDFQRFYATLTEPLAHMLIQKEFSDPALYHWRANQAHPIEHLVRAEGEEKHLNVVMVSIESLGAEYIGSLGGQKGLTPYFDQLAKEGLFFTQLYATGTRTVRGLEALTLSVPPTPGHAVPMRPRNKNLFTLGGVFNTKGYDSVYIYGGYSYFDNMKNFFSGNGYTVIDRTAIQPEEISHETVWGVADEDLFKLVLKQMDERLAKPAAKPVFMHVMTTSNHRPFTYPSGRIDIPSGSGRAGAVKYTDYAIGQFVEAVKKKPWFNNTLFVFVADHTSIGRGQAHLSMDRYHIPMVMYAPSLLSPQKIETRASQIDVAPTILGRLNWSYTSEFFGRDILKGQGSPIFMANYQTVGFVDQNNVLVELRPKKSIKVMNAKSTEPSVVADHGSTVSRAIAFYQIAAGMYR